MEKINLEKLYYNKNGDKIVEYFNDANNAKIIKLEPQNPQSFYQFAGGKTEHSGFHDCSGCNMRVRVRFKMENSDSYNEYIKNQIKFFEFLKKNILRDLGIKRKIGNESTFVPLNTRTAFEKKYTRHILDLKRLLKEKDKNEYIDVYPKPENLMKIESFDYYLKEGTTVRIAPTPIIESVMNSVFKLGKMIFGGIGTAISMVYHFVVAAFNSLRLKNIQWVIGAVGKTMTKAIAGVSTFVSENMIAAKFANAADIGASSVWGTYVGSTAVTSIVGTAKVGSMGVAMGAIGAAALAVFLARNQMIKYATVDAGDIYDIDKENIDSIQKVSLEMKKKTLEELKKDFKEYGNSSKSTLQGIFGTEEAIVLKYDRYKQKCLIQFKKSKKKILISGKNLQYKLSLGETRGKKATESYGTTAARSLKSRQSRIEKWAKSIIGQKGGMSFIDAMEGNESQADSNYNPTNNYKLAESTMADAGSLFNAGTGWKEFAMANPYMAGKEALTYSATQAYAALPYVAGGAAALGAAAIVSNAVADSYIRADNKRRNIKYEKTGSYQDDGYILYCKKCNIDKKNY